MSEIDAPNGEIAAVCHRCGTEKANAFDPCGGCGFMPSGEGRALAWLFSAPHLNEAQLSEAARRIRAGERPDPSRAQLLLAREALGPSFATNTPLARRELVGLVLANVLLTPLVGFAVWFGLRLERPKAAAQAFSVTLPLSFVLAGVWGAVVLGRLF